MVPDRTPLGPSGGDRYDEAIVEQWRREGREVDVVAVAGAWPWPTSQDVARLHARLRTLGAGPVLLDGLVGCSAPEGIRTSASARPTAVLVHSLLADGAGAEAEEAAELDRRERRALAAAHLVVTTSGWARARLAERHGLDTAVVAPPGCASAPVAPGSLVGTGTAQLLSLGAVTPLKNHGVLLGALERLADLPWTLVVAGPTPDAGHLRRLRRQAVERGLQGRVRWVGSLAGPALEEAWARADLLVHPSRSETYGLVVAEALAHGIPAVVGAGTGAVEALTGTVGGPADGVPGAAVATGGPDELADVLRRWLCEPALRGRWRTAALHRRGLLQGWERTVEQIDLALGRIGA